MSNFIEKYIDILKGKTCSRKDYWTFYGVMWAIFLVIFWIGYIFEFHYDYGFNKEFYMFIFGLIIIFFSILLILLQIRRLRDANLSPWILLLQLLSFLGNSFGALGSIIIFVCLLLPSQNNKKYA